MKSTTKNNANGTYVENEVDADEVVVITHLDGDGALMVTGPTTITVTKPGNWTVVQF